MIFNIGGGRPMQWAMGTAPQSEGVMTISHMAFRPYAVVARPGDGGVGGLSAICTLYLVNPDTEAVILAKRKPSSGSDFSTMPSSDYDWDASTMTLTLRVAASSNTATQASYYAIGR